MKFIQLITLLILATSIISCASTSAKNMNERAISSAAKKTVGHRSVASNDITFETKNNLKVTEVVLSLNIESLKDSCDEKGCTLRDQTFRDQLPENIKNSSLVIEKKGDIFVYKDNYYSLHCSITGCTLIADRAHNKEILAEAAEKVSPVHKIYIVHD